MNYRPDIIQWNCRGLRPNYIEIILLWNQRMSVLCLEETFLKPIYDISFKHYSMNSYTFPDAQRTCDGAYTIVSNKTRHRSIKLYTYLESCCYFSHIAICYHHLFTCISPSSKPSMAGLVYIFLQLTQKCLIYVVLLDTIVYVDVKI